MTNHIYIVLVFSVLSLCIAGRDFYKILGIERDASESQIKKAYRKLSLQYHPDKCKTDECKTTFIDIQAAYDILSDNNKKRVYDIKGEEGVEERDKQNNQHGFNPFADLFGFGGNRGRQRNQDTQATIPVSLEDLYNGREIRFNVERQEVCEHCRGTGADDPNHVHKCPVCKGQGVVLQRIQLAPGFVQQIQQQCPQCGGKGTTYDQACHVCQGRKLVNKQRTMSVDIERGMNDGEHIIFENEGNQHPDLDPGNIVVVLQQRRHSIFVRDGNDLRMNLLISLKDALLGWENQVTHLDGHVVKFGKQGITIPGEVIKVEGEGMPVHKFPSQKGDLYITITINMPKSLTEKQRDVLSEVL